MNKTEYWKNFNLGEELQVAGSFIYNALKHLSKMRNFHHEYECFEVLYDAAVGIERLQKIAIILLEHTDETDQFFFENELRTHYHVQLMDRIKNLGYGGLGNNHNKLLSILQTFYQVNRYERYKLSSVGVATDERALLVEFISKGLSTTIEYEGIFPDPITDKMRRYFGKTLIKISSLLFNAINQQSRNLGIYTVEMESNSKAYKIFLREDFTFDDEINFKREILIYLIANCDIDHSIKYLRNIEPIDLDGSTADYIEFLLNSYKNPSMIDEFETRYEDLSSKEKKERLNVIQVIGEQLSYIEHPDDDEF